MSKNNKKVLSEEKDKWCTYNTFSIDGVDCSIGKQKGYQCTPYDRATCSYYREKEDNKDPETIVTGPGTVKTGVKNCSSTAGTSTSESATVNPPMSYGWVCPKCGRVNAPWKSTCDCYNGIATPYTPPSTPYTPIETPNPFDPYGPYKWGDAPGWWNKGPTCEILPKGSKFIVGVEYPDGHIEKCPSNYFSGLDTPIPCSTPTDLATSEEQAKKIIESNELNTSTSDPNSNYTLKGKNQGE